MSVTDYVVDTILVLVIFRQVRARELTAGTVLLPLAVIGYAGAHYLHGFPTGGNDLPLVAVFTAIGLVLGSWSGAATSVWRPADGRVLSRAGGVAVVTWVLGMGFRFGFAVWASTTAGDAALGRFSIRHDITSGQAWTTALVLMAFAEVLARVAILQLRRVRSTGPRTVAAAAVA